MCAPVCAACYWVELGSQLRIYRTMVAELTRKRREIGRLAGRAACARAKRSRRKFAQEAELLTGFGTVVASQAVETVPADAQWESLEIAGEISRQD
jgi:hypothetical protein